MAPMPLMCLAHSRPQGGAEPLQKGATQPWERGEASGSHSPPLKIVLGFGYISALKTFCSLPFLRGAAGARAFWMPFPGGGGGSLAFP